MWSKPWSYKEGLIIGAGLLVIGALLQITVGGINWNLFAWPVNLIVLSVYIIVLIAMHLLRKRVYLFGWLSHYSAAVSSLVWVVGMTVVMGLIRQAPSGHASNDILGFSQMISSWSFVLLYLWMATALGLTILRTSFPLKFGRLSFLLNHIGLFIALIAATLGNADMQRLKMMLIDNETGRALPEKSPVHLLLEEEVYGGTLQDWELTIQQSIPMAASVATEDTLKFTDFHSMGATYAVHLKAVNRKNRQTKEGWVSCGSFLFPYKALRLDSLTSLVMPEREPQRFASKVKVYTQEGTITEDTIEVNRPMEIEGWKIYQLSYDESKGGWSDISIFELVRDPWLPVVYTGIVMMMLGAVCLFVNAQKRKEEEKE